jgi:hypothetical protein
VEYDPFSTFAIGEVRRLICADGSIEVTALGKQKRLSDTPALLRATVRQGRKI